MTNTKIPQQAVMFDKGPKPEDKRPANLPGLQGTAQVGITRPMMVREDSPPYGEKRPSRGREM